MKKIAWYLLVPFLIISCLDQPECTGTKNTIGISFRTMIDGRVDTVRIVGINSTGTDSTFSGLKAATSVVLPVDYSKSNSTFQIQTLYRYYVLKLGYLAQPKFVNVNCPADFTVSNLGIIDQNGIDSIKVVSSTVSSPAQNNITIYRCPKNDIMKLSFRQWFMDTISRGKLDTRALSEVSADFRGTIYENVSTNTLPLPVNTASDRTNFTFEFTDGTSNSLYVKYNVGLKTLLVSCSEQKFPYKLSTISQNYGVVHIVKDSLVDPPKTNVELFRCPITNQITAVFKDAAGTTVSDTLKSVTADYLPGNVLYNNVIKSSVVLPLDPNADNTTFRFEFNKKTSVLTVGYTRTAQVFHSECGTQQAISLLQIIQSTNFGGDPKVTEPTVKFPTTNNLEIIQ